MGIVGFRALWYTYVFRLHLLIQYVPFQNAVFAKAPGSIWEIPGKQLVFATVSDINRADTKYFQEVGVKKLVLGFIAGMVGIALAVGVSVGLSSENTAEAKRQEEAVLEFSIGVPSDASVGRIVDAVRKAAGIGSNRADGFAVDSFFDITYMISPGGEGTIEIGIHAAPNSSDINAGAVIDRVRAAVGRKGEYVGHVTLIR